MSKPIILLDMDGVLVDHTAEILKEVNELFGKSYVPGDITNFEYTNFDPEERDFIYRWWERSDCYDLSRLDDTAIFTIKCLREWGRVMVCSTPFQGHIASKYNFLRRYFDHKDIILCYNKDLIKADVLVDDKPSNIEAFRATGGLGIIFDQPWNHEVLGARAYVLDDIGPPIMDYLMEENLIDFNI